MEVDKYFILSFLKKKTRYNEHEVQMYQTQWINCPVVNFVFLEYHTTYILDGLFDPELLTCRYY